MMWGRVAGSVTRQKSCLRLAPSERAARMMAGSVILTPSKVQMMAGNSAP